MRTFLKIFILSLFLPVSAFALADDGLDFDYTEDKNLTLKGYKQTEEEALDVASLIVAWVTTCANYLDPEASYVFLQMTGFSMEVSYARYIQEDGDMLVVRPDQEGYEEKLKTFVEQAYNHRGTDAELSFISYFKTLDNMQKTAVCYGIFAEVVKNHQVLLNSFANPKEQEKEK